MTGMMSYAAAARWSATIGVSVLVTFSVHKVEATSIPPHTAAARDVTLIQFRTPEQEERERQERYRQQQEEDQRTQRERERQQQEIKRRSIWGAIAYGPGSQRWGATHDFYFPSQAEREALRSCARSDCELVLRFSNTCGAVAVGDNGVVGQATDTDVEQAEKLAEARCARSGGYHCEVVVSQCSPEE